MAQPTTTEAHKMAQGSSQAFEQPRQAFCMHDNSTGNRLNRANNENIPMNNDNNLGLPLPAPRLHHSNVLKPTKMAKPRSIPDFIGTEGATANNGK